MSGIQDRDDDNNGKSKYDLCKTSFSLWQREELKKMFQSYTYPDKAMYESMAEKLNLQYRQVYKWFQNQRSKCRKDGTLARLNPEKTKPSDDVNPSIKNENELEEKSTVLYELVVDVVDENYDEN